LGVIAVTICLLLAVVHLATAERMYAAVAQLLVIKQGGRPLSVGQTDPIRNLETATDFFPTQMAILQSPKVVERAIELIGPKGLPTLLAKQSSGPTIQDMAHLAVQDYLSVTRPDRTALILAIEYRAGSPDEAVRMVKSLILSYEEFLHKHFEGSNSKIVSLITKARDDLSRELEGLEKKYIAFLQSCSLPLDDESGHALAHSQLVELDRAANEATTKALRLKSQLELGRKLSKEGAETWAIAYAISQLSGDQGEGLIPDLSAGPGAISLDYLRQVIKEQQELATLYGPGYSKVKELQEQIDEIQDRTHTSTSHLDQDRNRHLLTSLEQSLDAIKTMREEIKKQFQSEGERTRGMLIDMTVGKNLRENLERHKALFYTVVDQLKQTQFEADFSAINSQTIELANASNQPVYPRWAMALALALLSGCGLGTGAAFVADMLDTRIRSTQELRDILGLNVLGVVPHLSVGRVRAMGEMNLISQTMLRSPMAEAYRAVRTNFEFFRRGRSAQVVLVTSPMARDGKSITASNLAISLAHAGRKVLLIDADLRKPLLHSAYGLQRNPGLVHLLKDLLPFQRVVQRTSIEDLDLVTAGPEISNPSELLMSSRLRKRIDEVRSLYDIVILDSPPLLPVTDPAILGASVDGILLVVRASIIKRHEAIDAMESLQAVGTPVLGVVINGCELRQNEYNYWQGAYGGDGLALTAEVAIAPSSAESSIDGQESNVSGSRDSEA